jgi:hypothetical protein
MVPYGFHDAYRPRWQTAVVPIACVAVVLVVLRSYGVGDNFDVAMGVAIVSTLSLSPRFRVTAAGIEIGRRVTPWAQVEVHKGRSGDVLASASGTRRPAAKFEFTLNRYAKDWRTSPLGAHIACYAPHLVDPASAVTTLSSTSQ